MKALAVAMLGRGVVFRRQYNPPPEHRNPEALTQPKVQKLSLQSTSLDLQQPAFFANSPRNDPVRSNDPALKYQIGHRYDCMEFPPHQK